MVFITIILDKNEAGVLDEIEKYLKEGNYRPGGATRTPKALKTPGNKPFRDINIPI